jgi:hypothetical protein
MERRQFLAASLATSVATVAAGAGAQVPASPAREYYLLRKYSMQSGPQTKLTESFIGDAFIPALTALQWGPSALRRHRPETHVLYVPFRPSVESRAGFFTRMLIHV